MKLFMCFGGAAPVADDEAAEARHQGKRAGRKRLPSFRWRRFFPGKLQGKKKRPSPPAAAKTNKKRAMDMNVDDSAGGDVFGAFTASSSSSSSSSSRLSCACPCACACACASSLYSHYSSSPSTPARSSSAASCSLLLTASGALSPASPPRRRVKGSSSPAAGAAAVVLCLLLVVFCGRVGATLLTPTALYLFPRRWPAKAHRDDALYKSLQCDAEEEETAMRNRNSN